jgi:uncharacterized metal-binding protein YceD (DUF177 family)
LQIVFDKIGHTPKPLEQSIDGVRLKGTLTKERFHKVLLDSHLDGEIELCCDRCGKSYQHIFDDELRLTITDEAIEDKDDLDIIEFLDGIIDIDFIIKSEINAIEGSFHYCDDCCDSEEELEIEF